MRLLSFSLVKYCKLNRNRYYLCRQLSSDAVPAEADFGADKLLGDPSLVSVCESWGPHEEADLRAAAARDMRVLPDFVSEPEEAALLAELEPVLKRMRYEYDHWDNAIEGYRETERRAWTAGNAAVIARVVRVAFPPPEPGSVPAPGCEPLPHQHVLDLAPGGHIKPHVDAVRFCGATIAGLCLASSAVMRLTHVRRPHLALDALLQRRALYIMTGVARYEFRHEVLGGEHSTWRGERVPRHRRVAVICRSAPLPRHVST